ncbi:hypothetical protein Tco_0869970, partial [Tanacetum coccineum]
MERVLVTFASLYVDNKKYGNILNTGNNRGLNPNLLCKNCGKVRHTIDKCFDLIGYPLGYNKNHGPKQNGSKTFNANFASPSNENGTSLSFTNEQRMKLMNHINEVPSRNMEAIVAVSNLKEVKKYYPDDPLVVSLEGLHVDEKLHFVEKLLEDHIPVYIPELEHHEDLVPAEDEAPTPLLPPFFLSLRIRPPRTKAAMAQMRATTPSTYHSLL